MIRLTNQIVLMPCGRAHHPRVLERLGEPSFQELAQLGRRLELRNGIEFLKCGSERIRKTPDRPATGIPELVGVYVVDSISLCGAEIYVASASGRT